MGKVTERERERECSLPAHNPSPSSPSSPPGNFLYNWACEFATEHRGIFVVFFVLPFSILFDIYFAIRSYFIQKLYSAPALHKERVKDIQSQVLAWKKGGSTKRLCTARGGWQSISPGYRSYKQFSAKINVNLYDILELDEVNNTVRVEPMVSDGNEEGEGVDSFRFWGGGVFEY